MVNFFVDLIKIILWFAFGLIVLIVGGWLVVVGIFKGVMFVIATDWWQGIVTTHGHIVSIVALIIIFFIGALLFSWIFGGDK